MKLTFCGLLFLFMTNREKRYLTKIDEINQLFYKPTETYESSENLNQAVKDFLIDMYLEGYAITGYELDAEEKEADFEIIEELLLLNIDGKNLFDRINEYYIFADSGEKVTSSDKTTDKKSLSSTNKTTTKNTSAKPSDEVETEDVNIPYEAVKKPSVSPDEAIKRVIETESHRMYNEGGLQRGIESGKTHKKWVTMKDLKVRETHSYIEGVKVKIDEDFYTYDGDYAKAPGGFLSPENNVNCRCYLKFE